MSESGFRGRALCGSLRRRIIGTGGFSEAVRLDPGSGRAYLLRGTCWTEKNEFERAVLDFDQAIGLDCRDAHAYLRRGLVRATMSQYDDAITDLNEAVGRDPRNESNLMWR